MIATSIITHSVTYSRSSMRRRRRGLLERRVGQMEALRLPEHALQAPSTAKVARHVQVPTGATSRAELVRSSQEVV
jgi:hypothetical protein